MLLLKSIESIGAIFRDLEYLIETNFDE